MLSALSSKASSGSASESTAKSSLLGALSEATYLSKRIALSSLPKSSETEEGGCVLATVNADCLVAALHLRKCGFQPAVLNLANGTAPAAATHFGSEGGTQEECLFKRTSLFLSLWPRRDAARTHRPYAAYSEALSAAAKGTGSRFYPIDAAHGVVHSRSCLVFRASERSGYALLPLCQRSVVSVLTAQAPVCYSRAKFDAVYAPLFRSKIEALYKAALADGCDCLVLGALGCGIFGNPPDKVARLFRDVLEQCEAGALKRRVRRVVFAILWDHNSQPDLVQHFAEHFPLANCARAFTSKDGAVRSAPPRAQDRPSAEVRGEMPAVDEDAVLADLIDEKTED